MLAVLIHSENLDREYAGWQDLALNGSRRPAEHVRQENIQRNGSGMILAGESEALRAAGGHQHLESLVTRQIDEDTGVVRIVFDDE